LFDFLRNAFSTGEEKEIVSPEDIPEQRRKELILRLADGIVKRGLTAPAIFFLESVKPLNFLGSQAMIFFEPIVKTIFPFQAYTEFAVLLEDRQTLEHLICEIERLEGDTRRERKEQRKRWLFWVRRNRGPG